MSDTPKAIRVLLADDHAVVRQGIRRFLETGSRIEIVAEAADGGEALRLIREHRVAVMPGTAFGAAEGCHLRVSYGALDERTAAEGIGVHVARTVGQVGGRVSFRHLTGAGDPGIALPLAIPRLLAHGLRATRQPAAILAEISPTVTEARAPAKANASMINPIRHM